MWGLSALTAAIFFRTKCLRFREPSQARTEGGFEILISLHLQAEVQHRVHCRRDVPASLALHFTMQLTKECGVNDTITRDVRRPA